MSKLFDKFYKNLADQFVKNHPPKESLTNGIFPKNKGLLSNKAESWDAVKKWDFEYFSKNYGDKEVYIVDVKGVVAPNAPQNSETISLAQYIKEVKEGSLKYLKLSNLAQKEISLQEDLDLKWLKSLRDKFSFGETFYTFIGGKNTLTPLHNELPTTIYIQVFGEKKWTLYPPGDAPLIGARTERRPYFLSDHVPREKEPDFSLANHARKEVIILKPGDVLIVPPFYWHYVENLTDSIGVAYKFANVFTALKSSKLLTVLFLLSTKPSILYSFFANRIKKDDYLLTKENKENN